MGGDFDDDSDSDGVPSSLEVFRIQSELNNPIRTVKDYRIPKVFQGFTPHCGYRLGRDQLLTKLFTCVSPGGAARCHPHFSHIHGEWL